VESQKARGHRRIAATLDSVAVLGALDDE